MLDYNNSLKFLYKLQKVGIKMGLEKTKTILNYIGNPQNLYPTIHVAGTNGKGSTSAMIASILTASGYKTGLYTSPHLVRFNERIRIDGTPISDIDLAKYVNDFLPIFEELKPTFFEATTAIAFKYFADKKVDIAVIEVGMGGRLDSTNVIRPLLSIITSIGKDHTQYLGNTLEEITFEKAGIIKEKVPLITAVEKPNLLNIIKRVAKSKQSIVKVVTKSGKVDFIKSDICKAIVNVTVNRKLLKNLIIDFTATYQKCNILLALNAVEILKKSHNYSKINEKTIRFGLSNIRKFTGLRGRLEKISDKPLILGDVAHNPNAFQQLKNSLMSLGINNTITIFGIMKDKAISEIIPHMINFSKLVIAAEISIPRAMKSRDITALFRNFKFPCICGKSVENSLKIAKKLSRDDDVILITGSHYILGDAIKVLNS